MAAGEHHPASLAMNLNSMRVTAAWVGLALVIALADQGTKQLIGSLLAAGENRAVTGFFNLVLVFNRGAAFNLADSAITVGAALLILDGFRTRKAPAD